MTNQGAPMTLYTQINLAARPTPGPITRDLFEVVTKEVPSAGAGQLLVKQTHMSLDPAMIGWMRPVACPNCDGHLELLQKQTGRVRHYYKCKSCGLGRIDYYPDEKYRTI